MVSGSDTIPVLSWAMESISPSLSQSKEVHSLSGSNTRITTYIHNIHFLKCPSTSIVSTVGAN